MANSASSSLLPLLESLEDSSAGQTEQTDAYLTITSRLSGEDGCNFLPAVVKHFPRLGKVFQTHILCQNSELSQAALQALGFCVFHSSVVSGIPANIAEELLKSLTSLVVTVKDKNTCTRALWVISKQNFPVEVIAKQVPDILKTLETVQAREDIQSVVIGHEALNVVIRLLEQTPVEMGEAAVQWAKLVIPLVVHPASKVRLRAAAALEMGMPLLLKKQQEVATIIEPLMSSKLIPELQKLFSSKNESNVLKLWPLFVRLLGKLLHRGGPFINSLLHLEELGFRSSSPIIKKIAFIAWKSLIDNFALNPEILCSAKRLKLLMQPLSSIQVRTEALLLTKLEVWWYLVVKLGANLAANFEQVGVPLLQSAINVDSHAQTPATPARNANTSVGSSTPKAGGLALNSPGSAPRMNLNSSLHGQQAFPAIQLLGLEMLLHYFLGAEVTVAAAKHKLQLSLEPLGFPLLASPSSFNKFSSVLFTAVRDGFINVGKDAPDALLILIWNNLIGLVTVATETAGSKKERQGSEVLALLLQTLQSIVLSETLPADRTLVLLEATVKRLPQKILGSAAYQVANMDVLNGTPALFLFLLFFNNHLLPSFVSEERFFLCMETLVSCGLSGPTSSLAFSESALGIIGRTAELVENKELLWRMWSIVVNPLTDTIMQTNEVNQGDALEHNFTAVYSALIFPFSHFLSSQPLPQITQKSLLTTWSRLYKTFARCSALVATAEENVCCEELCCKIIAAVDQKFLSNLSTLDTVANILLVIIECVDFSPYTSKFQQKIKSPHTPLSWGRKKNRALGNLASFQTLLVLSLDALLSQGTKEMVAENTAVSVAGLASILLAVLTILFSNLAVPTATQEILSAVSNPLAMLFELSGRPQNEQPAFLTSLGPKLEKLLGEMLACLQTRAVMAYDSELLVLLTPLLRVLLPHRSKQMRTLVTQFWNGTFANATVLTYPEELKPILSQVKQKTLIILPGFQAVHLSGDYSGPDSGESSQLETKISGVTVTSAGKRDSLLSRAGQIREKMSSKPVSVKLDFGSPKLPRRELLEEEASLDFVFIPPETKERVLTEHQKEVKRTKRTDIPAMYNNLDASLDTTMFSQYTQSQDELMDKVSADDKADDAPVNELHVQAEQEQMDTEGSTQEAIEDGACNEETLAGVVNTSMQNSSLEAMEGNNSDFNASASSDMVSGTPQKPTSRRQSFITLEKYEERKTASPMTNTRFTGLPAGIPEGQTNNSQPFNTETMQDNAVNKKTLQVVIGPNLSLPNKDDQQNESVGQAEQEQVVRSEGENSSQDIEDKDGIIPNTQIDTPEAGSNLRDAKECTPPEEHPKSPPSDSQNSQISPSPLEVRRSGRRRSRPVRPGESREEVEEQQTLGAASKAGELMNRANAQTEVLSQGRATRSKTAVEGLTLEGKNRMSGRPSTAHRRHSQSDSQSVPLVLNLKDIKLQDGVIRKGRVMVDKDLRSPKTPIKEMKISTRNSQKAALLSPEPDVLPQGGPGKRNKVASALNKEMSHEEHSQESLQGPARYRTRRSSQGLLSSTENSESEGSESREENQTAKKRGRKPKVALTPSLLRNEGEQPDGVGQVGSQLQAEVESSELAEGSQSRTAVYEALGPSESLQNDLKFPKTTASDVSVKAPLERNAELVESTTVVKECVVLENTENKDSKLAVHEGCTELVEAASKSEVGHICPHAKRGQELQCTNGCHCKVAGAIAQDTDSADSQNTMGLREGVTSEDCLKPLVSLDSVPLQPGLASPQAVDSSTDDAVFETSTLLTPSGSDTSVISTVQTKESDLSVHKGESQEMLGIVDKFAKGTHDHDFQTEVVCDTEENVPGWELVEEHREALQEAQKQNGDESVASVLEESSVVSGEGEHTQIHDAASASLCQEPSVFPEDSVCVDSPPKQKILDAPSSLADAGQSPSRGKTRGVWSPSASPSTSILKKGQKRPLEEESSSPLLKSRRVSFADPIHHQELADDIDRRSPVIRSSSSNSPRSKNSAPSAQQKFAATPTKGLQTLSPRNLCSPGYRSSKKCLISEMSQEPKPIPKDCVYPALVGCSVPVEAILPQLTSNMWPRGFGQLVRARNIKTIGDLSALAPSEIKSLPIRSPKLSNVKKALKTYHEQQRKGRDELKAFDVMEKMTSEPEETEVSQSLVEGNVSLKVIETELSVVPLVADQKSSDLPSAVEALALHLTPEELGHCSPGQLVKMHEQLSNMMRRIVAQLQSRLPCGTNDS